MQSTLCRFNGIFVFFKKKQKKKNKKKTSKQNLRPKGFSLCGFTHACEKLEKGIWPRAPRILEPYFKALKC